MANFGNASPFRAMGYDPVGDVSLRKVAITGLLLACGAQPDELDELLALLMVQMVPDKPSLIYAQVHTALQTVREQRAHAHEWQENADDD
jgi:hypothetical protein